MTNTTEDEFPPISFSLRNMSGDAEEVTIERVTLGLGMHLLVRPGEDAISVSGSHTTFEEAAMVFAMIAATMLQSDMVRDEIREEIVDLINEAAEEAP